MKPTASPRAIAIRQNDTVCLPNQPTKGTLMKRRLIVTHHAIERFRERCHDRCYSQRSDGDVYGVVYGMVQRALPFGGQLAGSRLLRGDERSGSQGLVFVVRDNEFASAIVTVLTEEQAIANMQAAGLGGKF